MKRTIDHLFQYIETIRIDHCIRWDLGLGNPSSVSIERSFGCC